jgi:hypothetical protein
LLLPAVAGIFAFLETSGVQSHLETWITKLRTKLAAPEPDMSVRGIYLATEIRARLSAMTESERRKTLATADEATVIRWFDPPVPPFAIPR